MVVGLKAVIPNNKPFDPVKLEREINAAIDKTTDVGITLFYRTTNTWQTNVVFLRVRAVNGEGAVGTDSNIYEYVTKGTRPHLILPVRGKFLVFGQGQYNPVTRPGVLGSRRVGTGLQGTGGVARPIFARQVHHPGTKARNFDQLVADRLQPILLANVNKAILRSLD